MTVSTLKSIARWSALPWAVLAYVILFVRSRGAITQYVTFEGETYFCAARAPMKAITVGPWRFFDAETPVLIPKRLWNHEERHLDHWGWFGILFPLVYAGASCWSKWQHGTWYVHNWFELDASFHAL